MVDQQQSRLTKNICWGNFFLEQRWRAWNWNIIVGEPPSRVILRIFYYYFLKTFFLLQMRPNNISNIFIISIFSQWLHVRWIFEQKVAELNTKEFQFLENRIFKDLRFTVWRNLQNKLSQKNNFSTNKQWRIKCTRIFLK